MLRRTGAPVKARLLPQSVGNCRRIKIDQLPPRRLVAPPMESAMVGAAKRYHKLIADTATQCAWLHESQVMGFRRSPPRG
jgi:hypothetical protein